jgi:hypothetical protein
LRYLILSQARLPIPPQGHYGDLIRKPAATCQRLTIFRPDKALSGRWRRAYDPYQPIQPKEFAMNEEVFNMSLRKFLKVVGITSQQEIEKAVRAALADGRLKGHEKLEAKMVLTIGPVSLDHKVDGTIELG